MQRDVHGGHAALLARPTNATQAYMEVNQADLKHDWNLQRKAMYMEVMNEPSQDQ